MQRETSDLQFNKSIGARSNKDAVVARIMHAIQSNRLEKQCILSAVPGLTTAQFSQLRAGEADRFSYNRLEQIENFISILIAGRSTCECAA